MRGSVVAGMHRRFALALSAALLCACAAPSVRERRAPQAGASARVVTLVPSFADDVDAVGAGSQLVAVSAFTDAPSAQRLPRVADASSVDAEAIVALHPSLVIGIPAQSRFTEPLRRAHVRVVLYADDGYDDIFENLERIGVLTGHRREAAATVRALRRETAALHARTRRFARHPSVFVVLGSAPIWTAGSASYISKLIELAGGSNAATDLPQAYGQYSAEALLRDQPDMLVTDPATRLDAVTGREPWRSLRAVRLHRVYPVDPDIIERPGPKYNVGVAWLLAHIEPLARRAVP